MGIVGDVVGGLFGASSKDEADDQAAENYKEWAKKFRPTEKEKLAMRKRGMARIDSDFLGANKTLSNSLASRGLGGGVLGTGLADNTRERERSLGDLETQVELFGFGKAPPSPAPVNLGMGDYFMSDMGNQMQYMSGMGMGKNGGNLSWFGSLGKLFPF